jgi:rsbT co-antagonist protein RsbR
MQPHPTIVSRLRRLPLRALLQQDRKPEEGSASMNKETESLLSILTDEETAVVDEWLKESRIPEQRRRSAHNEAAQLLHAVRDGLRAGADPANLDDERWSPLMHGLEALSSSRVAQGQSAGDTSMFVLAFKRPLLSASQRRLGANPSLLIDAVWTISTLVDRMAQHTMSTYQHTREQVIRRQQQELLELSTPVIKLWEGVLAVPMIGTLDSSRTQVVMETLLQKIVDTESGLAIIDITGVPTVDTLVAQHLLKTVSAIRLMGADCIISGIRPQIAQTIVHLGIDLEGISTKASLADALALALQRTGFRIVRTAE